MKISELESSDVDDIIRIFENQFVYKFAEDPHISREDILTTIWDDLICNLSSRTAFGYKAVYNSKLIGVAILKPSRWDSEILGINTTKISVFVKKYQKSVVDKLLTVLHNKAVENNIQLIFTRINLNNIFLIQHLLSQNYFLADILISLNKIEERESVVDIKQPSNLIIEDVKMEYEEKLVDITRSAYIYSHYYTDTLIHFEKAEKIYIEWIKNSLRGYANKILVAKQNKHIVGYITCKVIPIGKSRYGLIDLIAVRKSYQQKDIGLHLILSALKWFSNHVRTVYVATQAQNIAAIRLYEKTGFRIVSSEATLHHWLV